MLQKDGERVEAVIIVEPEDEGHSGAYMGKYRMVSLDMTLPFSAVPCVLSVPAVFRAGPGVCWPMRRFPGRAGDPTARNNGHEDGR